MILIGLEKSPSIPIDFEGIIPERLEHLSESDLKRLRIRVGNRLEELGQVCVVHVQNDSSISLADLWLQGDFQNVKHIGAGMTRGSIRVLGNIGMHAGAKMTGGKILIEGNAEAWLGAEIRGGRIQIHGNVGSQAGGAYRGSRRGMTGGLISIRGDAGDELGLRMRRGMIRIHGNCGRFAGASMIAGTIAVHGRLGECPGAGMIRGTILAMKGLPTLTNGFVPSCEGSPQYLHLLMRHFFKGSWPLDRMPLDEYLKVRCYRGDLMTGGRGEILEVIS